MQFLNRTFQITVERNQNNFIKSLVQNHVGKWNLYFSTVSSAPDQIFKQMRNTLDVNKLQKPRKPATPFIRFLQSTRSSISRENPDLSNLGVVKHAAQMWKNADEDIKTKFQIEYLAESEKYQANILEFNRRLTQEEMMILKKNEMKMKEHRYHKRLRSKLKIFEKPKRPMNAFALYLVSKQPELQNINAQDYCHQIAEEWKNLPVRKKLKFHKQTKELQKEYYEKLGEWKENLKRIDEMSS